MVHHNICPLCSSEKIKSHLNCTDYFISREPFALFKCSDCSLVFTQNYPEEAEIGNYYESDDYISHSDTSEGITNKLYRIARNVMLRIKKSKIIKATGLKSGRILDIGSGTGHFALTMKRAGWKVTGIEINKKARDFAKSQFELDTVDPKEIAGLEANSFDCITLWHVLEHFHDLNKYLSDILHLLKPGGICVIAVPNCNSADADYYAKYWAAYDVPRHLWHFNDASFRLLADKSGFKLEATGKLPLDVFYISILSEKYKGTKLFFISGVLKALWFAFLSFFNNKKSSSVIYFLRKPMLQ
jgi:SAM-dependent methyltransferase